jgi:hypothetical protein
MQYLVKELAPRQALDSKGPAARVDVQEMPRREWLVLRGRQHHEPRLDAVTSQALGSDNR